MSLRSMHRTLVAWHHAWCRPVEETRVGSEEDAPVSPEEERNMALVRRFLEAQANADLDTLDELLAPEFVDHSSFANQEPGREGYMQQVAGDFYDFHLLPGGRLGLVVGDATGKGVPAA